MTDDSGQPPWHPAMFTRQLQEAGEQVAESQQEMMKQFLRASAAPVEASGLTSPGSNTATFKARVQSGGRISIPEPERDALDIAEGDIVQTIVVPVKRARESDDRAEES